MAQLIQRALILLTAVICAAPQARAQNPPARGPFAGLFGGGERAQNSQSLDFRTSLFGVWQDVLLPQNFDRSQLDPRFQLSGTFSAVNGFLDYAFDRRTENSAAYVAGLAWTSDYSTAPERPVFGAQAIAGLSHNVRLTRRTTLASAVSASYTPFFDFGPLAGTQTHDQNVVQNVVPTTVTPGLGFAGVSAQSVALTGTTGVSRALSRRSSIAGNLMVQRVSFLNQSSSGLTQLSGNAFYSHQLLRRLSVQVGYQSWESHVSNPPTWTGPTQSLYFTVDYGDGGTIRLTRRTTLSLGGALGSARVLPGTTVYRALGNATLQRTFGRTLIGYVGAARNLSFVAAFQQPVLFDSATAGFGGQLANRVSWTSQAYWARGYIGLDSARHYDSLFGTSLLSFGITRWLGGFAQYTFYHLGMPAESAALPVLTNGNRHTVSAGLSLYTPIYHSRRRTTP